MENRLLKEKRESLNQKYWVAVPVPVLEGVSAGVLNGVLE